MNGQILQEVLIIKPQKGIFNIGLKELFKYRELIFFFVWRDIKVRYKQTLIGVLWVILQPLVAMLIFSVFFGRFVKVPSDNIPYPIFVFVGLLIWNYFSFSLTHASNSMVDNSNIIQKIYFPRLVIPISSALIGLVDFFFSSLVLVALMFYYGFSLSLKGVLLIPLLLIITFLSSVGLGCLLASINVKYRDVRYIIPFFIQMLMFLTPVIYPVSIIKGKYRFLLSLNPMSGVIEAARNALLNTGAFNWADIRISVFMGLLLFVSGIMYFRKNERFFADVI